MWDSLKNATTQTILKEHSEKRKARIPMGTRKFLERQRWNCMLKVMSAERRIYLWQVEVVCCTGMGTTYRSIRSWIRPQNFWSINFNIWETYLFTLYNCRWALSRTSFGVNEATEIYIIFLWKIIICYGESQSLRVCYWVYLVLVLRTRSRKEKDASVPVVFLGIYKMPIYRCLSSDQFGCCHWRTNIHVAVTVYS